MEPIYISLKKQFYLTTISIVLFIILASFSYNIYTAYNYNKKAFLDETHLQATLIADNVVEPMLYLDVNAIKTKLLLVGKFDDVLEVDIYDKNTQEIASYKKHDFKIKPPIPKNNEEIFFNDNGISSPIESKYFILKHDITLNSVTYGHLYFVRSTKSLNNFLQNAITDTVYILLFLLIITIAFTIKISNKFVDPIIKLSKDIIKISRSNDYSVRLKYEQKNEIGKLYHSFNSLFQSIQLHQQKLQKLTDELEDRVKERTKELEESLDKLTKAQKQLVESEKMAALGSLVSGVAHEINTPLGNALTGSTIVHAEAKELINMVNNGTLKKSTLNEKLSDVEETSSLVVSSITRAANLVRSFKQISVDQSVEAIREYNVYSYLNEIILTFKSKLKQVPATVTVNGDQNIVIKSYPGVLAQILNNLINNSILHGFEHKKENAQITIDLETKENKLYFTYKDNGSGIDESIKDKVFDPFITTKRNAGGTGLGLNILYNLVTQKLRGEIYLNSQKDKGVEFKIIIPMNL